MEKEIKFNPERHQQVEGGGFVEKETLEQDEMRKNKAEFRNKKRPFSDKILGKGKTSYIDVAHDEALREDVNGAEERVREKEKKESREWEANTVRRTQDIKERAPVFVTYRDNSLFRNMMPRIIEDLKSMGKEVVLRVFPEGTDRDDIKKWFDENTAELEGKRMLWDYTADSAARHALSNHPAGTVESAALNRAAFDIDRVLAKVTTETILGPEYELAATPSIDEESDKLAEQSGDAYVQIIKRILRNEQIRPRLVNIIQKRITDHFPFNRRTEKAEAVAETTVKGWLVRAGVPETIINGRELPEGPVWEIIDRHVAGFDGGIMKFNDRGRPEKIVLRLPLVNTFLDAWNGGLIKLTPEEEQVHEKALRDAILEEFGPEMKNKH